jgi:hypothetical protein
MEIHRDEAQRILSDVPDEKRFFTHNGEIYANLSELQKGLRRLKTDDFKSHVNSEKNDFSNWIYDVIGDSELARDVRKAKKKTEIIRIIKDRIEYLKVRIELNE